MIPHHNRYDLISHQEVDRMLAALGLPPTFDYTLGEWWYRIVAATGIDVRRIDYPQASEWNAAADYANNLIATKENQ